MRLHHRNFCRESKLTIDLDSTSGGLHSFLISRFQIHSQYVLGPSSFKNAFICKGVIDNCVEFFPALFRKCRGNWSEHSKKCTQAVICDPGIKSAQTHRSQTISKFDQVGDCGVESVDILFECASNSFDGILRKDKCIGTDTCEAAEMVECFGFQVEWLIREL